MAISKWSYDKDFEQIYNIAKDLYQKLDNKQILITGATGLVGTCLTEFLIYLKIQYGIKIDVTILAFSSQNAKERFGNYIDDGTINAITQDIRNPLPTEKAYDYIVHAASIANPALYLEKPIDVIETTLTGTKNILDYCSAIHSKEDKKPRLLYISSVEVYGETKDLDREVTEDVFGYVDPFQVRCSYTESKRMAETACKAYSAQKEIDVVVARLSKVYGPSNNKSDTRVMAYILKQISSNQNIVLNSDGSRIFSFCYVIDAVSALVTILINGKTGEAYNVSDKNSIASLKQIADTSAKIAGVTVEYTPSENAAISKDTVVCSKRLESLGWQPLTNITSGLEKQYEGIKNQTRKGDK